MQQEIMKSRFKTEAFDTGWSPDVTLCPHLDPWMQSCLIKYHSNV